MERSAGGMAAPRFGPRASVVGRKQSAFNMTLRRTSANVLVLPPRGEPRSRLLIVRADYKYPRPLSCHSHLTFHYLPDPSIIMAAAIPHTKDVPSIHDTHCDGPGLLPSTAEWSRSKMVSLCLC